jgi:hypothetical protein
MDPQLKKFIKDQGIQVIGYQHLRALMRTA